MSRLERRWWYAAACLVFAALATLVLFTAAGYPIPFGEHRDIAAQTVFFLCLACLQRATSIFAWSLILLVSPKFAREQG